MEKQNEQVPAWYYRNESSRRKGHDYTLPGCYFITICTRNRFQFFGKIDGGVWMPCDVGEIAEQYWQEIPKHFRSVELGAYQVMPNHVHGIICINQPPSEKHTCRDVARNVHNKVKNEHMSSISPKPGSIGTIIRSYKSAVTRWCREQNIPFDWQPRYFDHIIRNTAQFDHITEYILDNPRNWNTDLLR